MKIDRDTQSKLPTGWSTASIGEITLSIQKIDPLDDPEREIDYIDISSIDNVRNVVGEAKRFRLKDAPSRARQIVRTGDVLFATVRPYLRNIAAVPAKFDTEIASTGFAVLRPASGIEPKFLFYKSTSSDFVNALSVEQYGVSYPAVTDDQVREQVIPVPPCKEQCRIVAKIEALFSELDDGIESLAVARGQLRVYRQSVLKYAFEGKLTMQWRATHSAPQWTTSTLSKHLEFLTSGSRGWAQYYSKDGDVFIRAQNLKHDRLDLDDIAYVSLPQNSEGMRTRVQSGDVLITITGANVTKTGYVKADIGTAYVSQHVALVRPAPTILTEFLYWFLIAEAAGRKQLSTSAYGAGKPGLNLENIRSVKIDLPPLDEQVEIVTRINSMLSIEEAVTAQLNHEIGICDALRHSILKKAFSGQLLAQDPYDEHASVLLERIKTEKAEKENGKKKMKRNAAA
jgi:type I restriction enzyme S subunit